MDYQNDMYRLYIDEYFEYPDVSFVEIVPEQNVTIHSQKHTSHNYSTNYHFMFREI
jgi:hypothetical protein